MTTDTVGPGSVPSMVAASAARFGSRPAVVDGDSRITYAELAEESRRFGGALVASGIGPGDRVALWAPNSARWIVAALGLFGAGAVLVPVNTRFKGPEAADILARSRSRALVTVTDFLGTDYVSMLGDAGVDLPDLATIVVAAGPSPGGSEPWGGFVARATDADLIEVDRRSAAAGADDPSDILFTSGTTGVPKGVVQTNGRTLLVATDWAAMTGLVADDRYLMVNPYFHMFGLKAGILAAVHAGATMVPVPVFDVDRVLALVAEHGITVLPGPPSLYQGILDHPGRSAHDLSTHRGGRHSRRAGPATPRGAALLRRDHRVRAHRRGHRRGHRARGRRRDHRRHGGEAAARVRTPDRRRPGG
jgi:acyl-CoA synthetase (AMP-forming)/AMP-acid ligase II